MTSDGMPGSEELLRQARESATRPMPVPPDTPAPVPPAASPVPGRRAAARPRPEQPTVIPNRGAVVAVVAALVIAMVVAAIVAFVSATP